MMGKAQHSPAKLFHVGFNLEDRVPADHPLRRIAAAVDFSFVRPLVADLYGHNGHVSLDPTLILKLLFLCHYENVRSERELLRQLPLRLDWLWFCGLSIEDVAPDHSVLSKARRRWGEQRFERIFQQVLRLCVQAGLVGQHTAHADSTLLRASAALDGRVPRQLWNQLEQAAAPACVDPSARQDQPPTPPPAGGTGKLNGRLVSPVDPDAATSTRKTGGTTLGYRDHRLVDDHVGIITATVATPADRDDGAMLPALLAKSQSYTHGLPREAVGDSMYGTQANYQLLEQLHIKAYLKKRRGKDSPRVSWLSLLAPGCWRDRAVHLLARRKSVAEGSFAEAHVRHGHRRCRWRRRWRVQIQCYLVATVQNVKKLAKQAPRNRPIGVVQARRRAAAGAGIIGQFVTAMAAFRFGLSLGRG
jgi:transposase